MNPFIKQILDKINKKGDFTEGQLRSIAVEIGDILNQVICATKDNPNINLKGEDCKDESTLGNFLIETKSKKLWE